MSPEPARMVQLLTEILLGEAALFAELADLAKDQRRALLVPDEVRLTAIAARAETLVTRYRLLDEERVRIEGAGDVALTPDLERAKNGVLEALGRLLHETAVSGAVLERLGDTVGARQVAIGGLFGNTYLPNGRTLGAGDVGRALCAEG